MQKVILFKSPENSSEYVYIFEKNGFIPMFLPVLEFKFINMDGLREKLAKSSNYEGLIFTSQRGVEAVQENLVGDCKQTKESWRNKPIFAVGETTNLKIKECLSLDGVGEESGNASALADFIIKQNEAEKFKLPLLFPCGNLKSEMLPGKLKENDIQLDPTVVYTTQEDPSLREKLITLQENGGLPSNLVFFSPSGVNFVLPILKEIGLNIDNSNIVAIGPLTEKRIIDLGYKVLATAKEPTPSGIFSCFTSELNS